MVLILTLAPARVAELAMLPHVRHASHHFILTEKKVAFAPTARLPQLRSNVSKTKITVFGDRTSAMQTGPAIKEAVVDGVVAAIILMEGIPLQSYAADQIRCG